MTQSGKKLPKTRNWGETDRNTECARHPSATGTQQAASTPLKIRDEEGTFTAVTCTTSKIAEDRCYASDGRFRA